MLGSSPVTGVFSAKEPDSSFGGVPVVFCPDDDHMKEEVQLKVQVEEEETGETHGKEQGEEQRVNRTDQPHNVDDHVDDVTRTNTILSQAV